MKPTLKKLQINLPFSEETIMFKAELYIGGVHIGEIKNDGRGGCTHVSCVSPGIRKQYYDLACTEAVQAAIEEILDWAVLQEEMKPQMKRKLMFKYGDEVMAHAWKQSIAQVLKIPAGREKIKSIIASEKIKGNKLINTNIPRELL